MSRNNGQKCVECGTQMPRTQPTRYICLECVSEKKIGSAVDAWLRFHDKPDARPNSVGRDVLWLSQDEFDEFSYQIFEASGADSEEALLNLSAFVHGALMRCREHYENEGEGR